MQESWPFSAFKKIEGGNTIEDTKQLIPILIEHGIDAFEVSGGSQYDAPNKIIPSHGEPCAVNLNEALEIRKISSVPVILVGKINSSELAKSLIDENKVDGVVLGRALLAEPEFVNKIKQNKENEIAPCASCLVGCVLEQNKKHKGACVINPFAGKEVSVENLLSETLIHREKGSGTLAILEDKLLEHNESLERFHRHICISSFKMIIDLIKSGYGISFVYEVLAKSDPELGIFTLKGEPLIREFNIIYLKYAEVEEKIGWFLDW